MRRKNLEEVMPSLFAFCRGMLPPLLLIILLPQVSSTEDDLKRRRLLYLLDKEPKQYSSASPAFRFLAYRDEDISSANFGTELCMLEVSGREVSLKVSDARAHGKVVAIYQSTTPSNAIAAVNGGFFGFDTEGNYIPLGLVKEGGKQKNPRFPWSGGGVVFGEQKNVAISRVSKFEDASEIMTAVQSKPLLIENGLDGIRSLVGQRFDRSAVAITSSGRVLISVIHSPGGRTADLAEYSKLLLKWRDQEGGRVTWALAMDGGPGAHLYVPALSRHCGGGEPRYIPNILYITP